MRSMSMTKWLCLLVLFASPMPIVQAAEAPASEASIRELLTLTQAQRMLADTTDQIDSMMQTSMKQAHGNKALTPREEEILTEMRGKILVAVGDFLKWSDLEPMFIDIYKRSFSQREIDGIIEFYRSDAGRAVTNKMPLVMQNTMQAIQGRLGQLGPKMQALQRETIEKLAAEERASAEASGDTASPPAQ